MQIPAKAYTMLQHDASAADLVREKVLTTSGQPVSPRHASRWKAAYDHNDAECVDDFAEPDQRDVDVAKVVQLLKDRPMTRQQLSERLDRSEVSVQGIIDAMEAEGYNLLVEKNRVSVPSTHSVRPIQPIPEPLSKDMCLTVAFPSDNHGGSKEEQISALLSFRRRAREMGARKFLHSGDMSTGFHMYKGHQLDVYAPTLEGQLACAERTLTPAEDEDWYMLGGNHDFSWLKSGNSDIVWQHCQKWSNVHYLGYDQFDVPLTDKVSVRLWHPTGGLPYAASYRLQKGMETLAFEELLKDIRDSRVKILVAGHLHVAMEMPLGGIYGFQAGCFEGQTSLLKRLAKYPRIGGYVVTFHWNDSGNLTRVDSSWLPYEPIKNDYKRYPEIESTQEPDKIEYLYRLTEDGGPGSANRGDN